MESRLEKYSIRINQPYLLGVYLAINAIPDSYLVLDMNDCAFYKAQYIHGNHDILSTLMDCNGFHRIINTCTNIENIVMDRSSVISEHIQKVHDYEPSKVIFVSGFSISDLVGTQFDLIIRNMENTCHKPLLLVPPKSLSCDWLEGYENALIALAKQIDLSDAHPSDDTVAVIGYLMDRNEEDHKGNIRELKRMLNALDLDVACIWLEGEPFQSLMNVKNAGTIISMPYGRKAARILSERTGATLIEANVPFGISDTIKWLNTIAGALKRKNQAGKFIKNEMSRIIPMLEWIVPHAFLHKTVFFLGDVHLLEGFYNLALEIGCRVPLMVGMGKKDYHNSSAKDFWDPSETNVLFEPNLMTVSRLLKQIDIEHPLDLIISNDFFNSDVSYSNKRLKTISFGFPSIYFHALIDRPFLGFRGCMYFLNRMSNALFQE